MHEIGILQEVIKTVNQIAEEEKLEKVEKVVLQIGELSLVVPQYMQESYPAVIEKLPLFQDSTLEIEIIPGVAKCTKCGEIYNLVENKGYCPKCNSFDKDIIDGKDLVLKEVLAK